jgi:uncharacterized membrane protein
VRLDSDLADLGVDGFAQAAQLEFRRRDRALEAEAAGHRRGPMIPSLPQAVDARPFLWQDGKIVELPLLPGSYAGALNAINDAGWAAGSSWLPSSPGAYIYHATRWSPDGHVTDLGVLPGSTRSGATDVNDVGQIIGSSEDFSSPTIPVQYLSSGPDIRPS